MDEPSDTELVEAARRGDVTGLGVLLERHRAAMRASAVRVLGWRAEVDDAVQDAMVSAIKGLDGLRDPAAAGPWLWAIARNAARMRLRTNVRPPSAGDVGEARCVRPTPEEVVDGLALRDWLWTGIGDLSEPLQKVLLLRFFSSASSYAQIAAADGIPVGTVRSRLNLARSTLVASLREASTRSHPDAAEGHRRSERTALDFLSAATEGDFRQQLAELTTQQVRIVGPQGQRERGRGLLATIMESDLEAGVRQRLRNVVAGSRVTIWECELISPPSDPTHCPPAVLWLLTFEGSRVDEIRLYHPAA